MKTVFAALALTAAGVSCALFNLYAPATAQEAELVELESLESKVLNPRNIQKAELVDGPATIYLQYRGEPGLFKLVETPQGLLQLNSSSAECTILARDDKGGLTRTTIAAPAGLHGHSVKYANTWAPAGKSAIFEVLASKAGTLLHDTRDGRLWQLDKNAEGKLVWASTDPDAVKPGDAYLGVSTEAVEKGGLRITQVHEGTAAAAVGLKAGDIIEQADGTDIKATADFHKLIRAKKPGETLKLKLRREAGKNPVSFTLEVTLGEYK